MVDNYVGGWVKPSLKVICPSKEYNERASKFIPCEGGPRISDSSVSDQKADESAEDSSNIRADNKSCAPEIYTEVPDREVYTEVTDREVYTEVPDREVYTEVPYRELYTEVPDRRSSCCISIKEKVIAKKKLNKTDQLSDFTLVDGSIYIRKSALDTSAATDAAPRSEQSETAKPKSTELPDIHEDVALGSKAIQVTNVKECSLCCKHLKCGLKDLLRLCDSDPDAVIGLYEARNAPCRMPEEDSDDEFVFLMDKTHGDVFGDEKYHYLMVDKSTLLNEVIPDPLSGVSIDISIKSVTKKSARIVIEEKKSSISMIFRGVGPPKAAEDRNTPPEVIPPVQAVPPPDIIVQDSKTEKEIKIPSHDTLTPPDEGKESSPAELRSKETSEQSIEPEHEKSFEQIPLESISEQCGQNTHRVSIIWDEAIDPSSCLVRRASDDKERRVSAISWSGINEQRLADLNKNRKSSVIGTPHGMQRTGRGSSRRGLTQNSLFEDIVKQERMKSVDTSHSRPRGKSFIEAKERSNSYSKKKWFGVLKIRKPSDPVAGPIQGAIRRKSVIASVAHDVEEADSSCLIKEPPEGEKEDILTSRKNSLNAYRRRSVSVGNPDSEKNRALKQYLHNV